MSHFTLSNMDTWAWAAFSAAVALTGLATLDGLRPARPRLSPPQAMLLLGLAGMLVGLWFDADDGGLTRLAALCTAGAAESVDILGWHWSQLPAAHVGMVAGSLALLPLLAALRPAWRRHLVALLAQSLACTGWMFLGMAAGTLAFSEFAFFLGGERLPAPLLGGMFAGMVWGMAVSQLLAHRLRHTPPGWRTGSRPRT